MSERDDGSPASARREESERTQRSSWPHEWIRALREVGSTTPERRAAVLKDIESGSRPTPTYYLLLGVSELIAGFALIIDSDATLIGANVVAPLMTPIFGVSLGLMRGDLRLLRRALLAEFGGAALGVALCLVLGFLPFAGEPSAALLAQTRPTLIDLFVAALAGFAGALAMIDDRVSPALPGVAIATALNPPIAAIGLCLASGAYAGAWGAFLLFFANFLAILAVGAALFLVAGFVTRAEIGPVGGLLRRFAPAAVGLVLVTVLLSQYLVGLVQGLRTERAVREVLDTALSDEPNTALVKLELSRGDAGIDVLSTISTSRVVRPQRVQEIQDRLAARLGEPVRLFMRCSLARDVSAVGSTSVRPYLSLDGKVTEAPLSGDMRLLQQAEQVAREVAATHPELALDDVELLRVASRPVLVVTVASARSPSPEDVGRFEGLLRERLGEPTLRVVARRTASVDVTSKGRILLGEAHLDAASPEEEARRAAVEDAVRSELERRPSTFVTAVDAVRGDAGWRVRAEAVAPSVPAPKEVREAEEAVSRSLGEAVTIGLWARADVQVTGDRYLPAGESPAR